MNLPAELILDSAGGQPPAPVLVTVVIPCYRRASVAREAALSVFAQDFPPGRYELIVVDSTPDDSVVEAMKEIAGRATCRFRLFRKQPEGPGPSRNVGGLSSAGHWIAFMDSDCQARPDWLAGARLHELDPAIGVMQGWTGPDPQIALGVFKYYVLVDKENFIYEACNIFYRREAFTQAGGFPRDLTPRSDIILGGEDLELAWKVKQLGWKSCFAGDARVYHEVFPLPFWRWVYIKRILVWPRMTKRFPGLRQYWHLRYFYEPAQFYITLLLGSLVAAFFNPWFALLSLPYVVHRASGPTGTLRGPLRLLRPCFYILRDSCSFFILIAGSVRFRCLLL